MANVNPAAGGFQSHYAHSGVTSTQGQTNQPHPHNGQATHTGTTTGTAPVGQGPQGPSQNSHRGQNVNTSA